MTLATRKLAAAALAIATLVAAVLTACEQDRDVAGCIMICAGSAGRKVPFNRSDGTTGYCVCETYDAGGQ